MRKYNATFIGMGLFASAAFGANIAEQPQLARSQEKPTIPMLDPYTSRLQRLADKIGVTAAKSPNQFAGKPTGAVGLEVPTENGGRLIVTAQNQIGKTGLAGTVMINVQQDVPDGRSFDLSFYKVENGTWTTACTDNVSVSGTGLSEVGQSTVYAGSKVILESPVDANAILGDQITSADRIVRAISDYAGYPIPPFDDVCAISLGDGPSNRP